MVSIAHKNLGSNNTFCKYTLYCDLTLENILSCTLAKYLLMSSHNKEYIYGTYYLTVDFCVAMDTNNFILRINYYDYVQFLLVQMQKKELHH